MKLFFNFLIITFCFFNLGCKPIKDPKLISLKNIKIQPKGDTYIINSDVIIYNPNVFPLSSKKVNIDLFFEENFIGNIRLLNDFNINKLDTLILKSELKLEPKILSKPISIGDTLNIRAKGIAKAPMLFFDYKFDINYKLLSSDLLYPLVNENLNESDFRLEITKIKNINLSKIDMLSNVNFKNNFDFDYLIKKLDIKIFPSKELEKELGKSSLKKPILIKKRSEINIENNISLETKKFGFSLVKGIFKKKYSFFITADALIEFNQIQIPLKIIRQINYNPITKEINIQE